MHTLQVHGSGLSSARGSRTRGYSSTLPGRDRQASNWFLLGIHEWRQSSLYRAEWQLLLDTGKTGFCERGTRKQNNMELGKFWGNLLGNRRLQVVFFFSSL